MEEAMARTESNSLDADQKLYLLILRTTILSQLLLKTKDKKKAANYTAINISRRAAQASKKRKRDEVERDIKESISDQSE